MDDGRKGKATGRLTRNHARGVSLEWMNPSRIFRGTIDDEDSYEAEVREELLTFSKDELRALPSPTLSSPVEHVFMGVIQEPDPGPEYTSKSFDWNGIPVEVDVFHQMDTLLDSPHEYSNIGGLTREDIQNASPRPPSRDIVEYSIAKARIQLGPNDKTSSTDIRNSALRELWRDPSSWPELEKECRAKREDPEIKALMKAFARSYRSRDPFLQAQRDKAAAEVPGLLRRVPDGTIYIAVDKHGAVLLFLFPRGLTFTYDEETTQHIFNDLATYARYEPPPKPDATRHPLDEEWTKEHPEFTAEQGGYRGIYHWGCHHELGHETITHVIKTADTRREHRVTARLRDELMRGACGVLTRAIYFWFGVLDPDLRAQCREVVEHTPACVLTTEKECFTMRAALFNVKTDSHRDTRDWKRGLAFLTPGAQFEGADLCVVDLGIQVPFPPGSIAAVRGREFEHFTSAWTGERTCVVHTNHQSVREEAEERMAEPEGQRGLAKRLRVEAANQRADARKEDKMQPGPEGGSGVGGARAIVKHPARGRAGRESALSKDWSRRKMEGILPSRHVSGYIWWHHMEFVTAHAFSIHVHFLCRLHC